MRLPGDIDIRGKVEADAQEITRLNVPAAKAVDGEGGDIGRNPDYLEMTFTDSPWHGTFVKDHLWTMHHYEKNTRCKEVDAGKDGAHKRGWHPAKAIDTIDKASILAKYLHFIDESPEARSRTNEIRNFCMQLETDLFY